MDSLRLGQYFSDTYQEARRRFRAEAAAKGAVLAALPLQCRGPDRGALTIDLAWVGSSTPRRVLMHCSGTHGVEAFAGSAIQLRALDELQPVETDDAIIFVHVLNPFGMAWCRRVNETNVDLNRNWLDERGEWTGMPEVYRVVSDLLNPSAIRPWDLFYLKAALLVLRFGSGSLRRAILGGQYENAKGLFYGGSRLAEGPTQFKAWFRDTASSIRRAFVIDVHTGLGKWCQNSVFFPLRSVKPDELPSDVGRCVVDDFEKSDIGYATRGGFERVYRELLGDIPLDFAIQEFGTRPATHVLKALRAENCHHQFGGGDLSHPSKRALKDAFCPTSSTWRASVLKDGLALFRAARRIILAT